MNCDPLPLARKGGTRTRKGANKITANQPQRCRCRVSDKETPYRVSRSPIHTIGPPSSVNFKTPGTPAKMSLREAL